MSRISKYFTVVDRFYFHQFASSNKEQHIKGRQDNLIWLSFVAHFGEAVKNSSTRELKNGAMRVSARDYLLLLEFSNS